jgi:hypothetical protein
MFAKGTSNECYLNTEQTIKTNVRNFKDKFAPYQINTLLVDLPLNGKKTIPKESLKP